LLFGKAAIFLNIFLLSKTCAEIPPFPPLKKGGRGGGIYEGHFRRLNSYRSENLETRNQYNLSFILTPGS